MPTVPHPEVLSPEFVPPTVFGRERELEQVRRILIPDDVDAPGSHAVLIRGASGSGTSAVARVSAHRITEWVHRSREGAPVVLVTLRAPSHRGTQGLAAELVRRLDEGFQPRGFHTMEMLAGFLRRLNRERRSAVIVVDDVGPSAPDLTPFFRAFLQPDRFLPEGVGARLSTWFLLAGRPEAAGLWGQALRCGFGPTSVVDLVPYGRRELDAIVRDRAARALGHPPAPELTERIAARAFGEGGSASRAVQLLRRELLGPEPRALPSDAGVGSARHLIDVELHLLEALATSLADAPAELGAIRAEEARRARRMGRRPIPTTTLWRRLLRLETAGLLRRRVRPGGPGGTRSTLEILRPISEWPVRPSRYDTPLTSYASPRPATGPASSAGAPGSAAPTSGLPIRPIAENWGA
ncbi:MAG: hypothetical protein L3J91_00390 [Thermoplasmata archaeon]|nr:hypothetical protein [Thermoplasmata archaeon]